MMLGEVSQVFCSKVMCLHIFIALLEWSFSLAAVGGLGLVV